MSTGSVTTAQVPWSREIAPDQWRAFWASFLGYMLDAMDFLMYSIVLVPILQEFHLNTATVALIGSTSMLSATVGGIFFGWLADRIGRVRSLVYTMLIYSVFSALTATSHTVTQLILWRTLLGLGMGGEWATGGALLMESWPSAHRGKASGFLQAGWPIGYMAAAALVALVFPIWGWRAVFYIGVLPALLTIWVRRGVREPEVYRQRMATDTGRWSELFSRKLVRGTVLGLLLLCSGALAYYSVFFWMPGFLSAPAAKGGVGMSVVKSAEWVIMMQVAGLASESTFGFFADRFGRKATFVVTVLAAAICVPLWGRLAHDLTWLFIVGILVGLFGSAYYSAFPVLLAELFPTRVRASAMGLIFNIGRGVASFGPPLVGFLALHYGIGSALGVTVAFYLLAVIWVLLIPETKAIDLT